MSLDVQRLEKVRELANGVTQARCPACAESGGDTKGEHLRIYPDGRYGCCVHPKDAQHRKRIFALAGDRQRLLSSERRSFTVKVATTTRPAEAARSVRGDLAGMLRTLRTGSSELVLSFDGPNDDFRTGRTPISNPRAHAREESDQAHIYKDCESGVLSVLGAEQPRQKLPFLTAGGTLSIPFDSPERYHWWKRDGERLTVREILAEVQARKEEVDNGAAF